MKFPRSFICHGREERCFHVRGETFPICSRCSGFYFGIALGILFSLFFGTPSVIYLFILTNVSLIPLAIDGIMQEWTSYESNNNLRFGTGIIIGVFIGMDIFWLLFLSL